MNLITKIFLLLSLLSMHSSIIAQGKFDSEFNTHGKQLLQQQCTLCHQLNKITGSSGYTLGQWQELISTMTDLSNHPERDL